MEKEGLGSGSFYKQATPDRVWIKRASTDTQLVIKGATVALLRFMGRV
jgi:hypothetical protein